MQNAITRTFLLSILIAAIGSADDNSKHLTHDQAAKDAKTFLSLLESTHADPYTNLGGKVAFKRKAQQLVTDIPADGVTVGELADRLSAFIVPLKDGHTHLSGASRERWVDPAKPMAVQFGFASDGMFIAGSDLPELRDARGYKLAAVNGHSVPDMLDLVNGQLSLENVYGSYYGLDLVLHTYRKLKNVLPDLQESAGVTFALTDPQGAAVQKTVHWGGEHPEDAGGWSDRPLRWSEMTHSKSEFYYAFLDNGRTGYFRVPTMTPRESYEIMKGYRIGDLKGTLERYYKSHKKEMPADIDQAIAGVPSLNEPGLELLTEMKRRATPNLIVDLRGNGGGSTPVIVPFFYRIWGDAYYARPANDESVQVFSPLYLEQRHTTLEEEKKRHPDFELGAYEFTADNESRTPQEKRNRQFNTWKENSLNWSAPLEALGGRPFYQPRKVVVLCDPGTFSAAFQAAFIAHQAGAAVVGVPSAQSPNAFMGGTEFVLPESGIKGIVSQGMQMYIPEDPRANIFHPDFEATYSIFARYNFDEETILRYALDLLASGKI